MTTRRAHGEGSIGSYQTKGGERFRIVWRELVDPDRPEAGIKQRVRGGFTTRKEAGVALRQVMTKLDAGETTTATKETFGTYALEWLEAKRVARATYAQYQRLLTLHAIPRMGHLQISAIRAGTLASLYRDLERSGSTRNGQVGRGLGPSTVRKVHAVVQSVLDAAVEDRLISTNPARRRNASPPSTRDVRSAKPEIEVWSPEQLSAFLSWVRGTDEPMRYLFATLARTGLRRGEALSLRWSDLDLKAGSMAVRRSTGRTFLKGEGQRIEEGPTKSGRSRVLKLDKATLADLRAQRLLLTTFDLSLIRPGAHVFVSHEGASWKPDHVLARFHGAQSTYNAMVGALDQLPALHVHGLRHTHATMLLAAGAHPKVVQERLGHSTISITLDTYSHLLPTTQGEAIDALDRLMEAAASGRTGDQAGDVSAELA